LRRHVSRGVLGSQALAACALAAIALPALARPAAATAFGTPIQTAVDMYPPGGREDGVAFAHARAVGVKLMRLVVSWRVVAPNPPDGDPANPSQPSYRWSELDGLISETVAHGLEPVVDITEPPSWAQAPAGSGPEHPDPAALGLFERAAATRYDGLDPAHPRVRFWEIWNEPNVSFFLQPQLEGANVVSAATYRAMVNEAAAGIHAARPDDVVIAGELFPNGFKRPNATGVAPLEFTRRVLCLSAGARPRRTCSTPLAADAWSVHPYTSGGPSTLPADPNNVWIRNLASLTKLVRSAQRLGTLVSARRVQTWVTEFSWDSNPPDPQGVPVRLQQRWVAEALYRGWAAGVSVFTWFTLRDKPLGTSLFQSGLYFACPAGEYCDTPKPAAAAFRFPFVAFSCPRRHAMVWGRTPAGARGTVAIQWRQGRAWRTLARLRTDRDGIFTALLKLPGRGSAGKGVLRAVLPGAGASPSFGLYHPPDIPATPFGS
jgi:hypothetical protein